MLMMYVLSNATMSPAPSDSMSTFEARAAAVAAYLRMFPAASALIESQGWGSSCPIADNITAGGRGRNKRIDVIIRPEGTIVGR